MTTIDYAMRVAHKLQAAGKLEPAETILNSILESAPNHADALHLSGIIAYQTGKMTLGVQLIQKAIEHNPHIALFHSNLGEMHRQLKDLPSSIQCGQRAVALDPNSATALSNLGIAYYDAKQYDEAENCHQRALAIHPHLSCSLNNLGSIYKTQGKTQKAIAFYQAAIAASPSFVEPLNNLGTLFLQQQEFSLAFEYVNRALSLAPRFADAHCNLGLALLGLDRYEEALLHFEKASQCKPHYVEAYYGMAKVYLRQHDFKSSENYIRQAIALNSQRVEFYQLLAEIYHEQGQHTAALKYLDHALSLDATQTNLHISKGSILMEMGEISNSEKQFLKIAEDPSADTRILAHYSLAHLRKIRADSPSVQALLSIARDIQEVSPDKLPYLYFALGKCHDDLGEWTQAFEYFSQGAALKRQRISYHTEDQIQFTQKLIHCFTQATIEHLRAFANPSDLPIFIVGMPRSGSTLVEQILASHPEVCGAGELTYLNDLIHCPIKAHPVKAGYPENILQFLPEHFHAITKQYLFYLRRISSDAIRITDKMPSNFIAIGLIHALFPNAKIIHVQRNPLDTCISCYTKLFSHGHYYSYDLTELGEYYHCYERIMNHWRQLLPTHAWLDIHYEDFIQNLELEAKRLIAYCDLSWDPACLAFYQSTRQVRTASFMQVRQPVYTSSVNRWRRFENELAPLINILKPKHD